jgi:hypothetical protein
MIIAPRLAVRTLPRERESKHSVHRIDCCCSVVSNATCCQQGEERPLFVDRFLSQRIDGRNGSPGKSVIDATHDTRSFEYQAGIAMDDNDVNWLFWLPEFLIDRTQIETPFSSRARCN